MRLKLGQANSIQNVSGWDEATGWGTAQVVFSGLTDYDTSNTTNIDVEVISPGNESGFSGQTTQSHWNIPELIWDGYAYVVDTDQPMVWTVTGSDLPAVGSEVEVTFAGFRSDVSGDRSSNLTVNGVTLFYSNPDGTTSDNPEEPAKAVVQIQDNGSGVPQLTFSLESAVDPANTAYSNFFIVSDSIGPEVISVTDSVGSTSDRITKGENATIEFSESVTVSSVQLQNADGSFVADLAIQSSTSNSVTVLGSRGELRYGDSDNKILVTLDDSTVLEYSENITLRAPSGTYWVNGSNPDTTSDYSVFYEVLTPPADGYQLIWQDPNNVGGTEPETLIKSDGTVPDIENPGDIPFWGYDETYGTTSEQKIYTAELDDQLFAITGNAAANETVDVSLGTVSVGIQESTSADVSFSDLTADFVAMSLNETTSISDTTSTSTNTASSIASSVSVGGSFDETVFFVSSINETVSVNDSLNVVNNVIIDIDDSATAEESMSSVIKKYSVYINDSTETRGRFFNAAEEVVFVSINENISANDVKGDIANVNSSFIESTSTEDSNSIFSYSYVGIEGNVVPYEDNSVIGNASINVTGSSSAEHSIISTINANSGIEEAVSPDSSFNERGMASAYITDSVTANDTESIASMNVPVGVQESGTAVEYVSREITKFTALRKEIASAEDDYSYSFILPIPSEHHTVEEVDRYKTSKTPYNNNNRVSLDLNRGHSFFNAIQDQFGFKDVYTSKLPVVYVEGQYRKFKYFEKRIEDISTDLYDWNEVFTNSKLLEFIGEHRKDFYDITSVDTSYVTISIQYLMIDEDLEGHTLKMKIDMCNTATS